MLTNLSMTKYCICNCKQFFSSINISSIKEIRTKREPSIICKTKEKVQSKIKIDEL